LSAIWTGIKVPKTTTLKRYGLSLPEWEEIWRRQGNVCPICKKSPPTGNVHIDHYHSKGFKKMKPDEKKTFVRGILCSYCNLRVITRAMNLFKAKNLVVYLEDFERRHEVDVVQKLHDQD
jgi:hypothetical protein